MGGHRLHCKAGWLIRSEEEGKLQVQRDSLQEGGRRGGWIQCSSVCVYVCVAVGAWPAALEMRVLHP